MWSKLLAILSVFLLTACAGGIKFPYDFGGTMNRIDKDLRYSHVYLGDPVFIRIFKEEHILELWMRSEETNQYKLVKSYPICQWSGHLGPKYFEGDHQSPEGFYYTNTESLNPESMYHLSFNINFPNEFDRYYGRTGSFIMVHGDCVSEGCFAMTDPLMEEIYILVDHALRRSVDEVPVHVFPFRMTAQRMQQARNNPNYPFWRNLKEGHDFFEKHGYPPRWIVKYGEYDFY